MPTERISYIDRESGQRCIEKVFGDRLLRLLYGNHVISQWLGRPLRKGVSRRNLFSRLVGWYYHLACTKRAIKPFIETYHVDEAEFAKKVEDFTSFSDFFVRKLKPECRPIAPNDNVAVIPADGRYYFFEDISAIGPFDIKGRCFDISSLLQSEQLAQSYAHGSMVLARLCPSDYHRFHFPIECVPSDSRLINGFLYSVNPIAIRQNVRIFSENKRMITTLQSETFGDVLFIDVGATTVGSITQTYQANLKANKGSEKGFFDFGGSALVLLFPEKTICFDEDLLAATRQKIEIRCLMGQSMGKSL